MINFEIMNSEDTNKCIELVADSFQDYEYFSLYIPNDFQRKKFLNYILKSEFKVNKDNEIFLVAKKDDEIIGVVLLCSPKYKEPSYIKYITSGVLKAISSVGLKSSIAWIKMEYEAKEPCLQLKNQTWYVNSITVRKDLQGQGIGTDIIQNGIIPFVKQHGGKEICLFTNSEINRKFYNKNGFNEFHHQEFSYNNKSIGSWSYKKDI